MECLSFICSATEDMPDREAPLSGYSEQKGKSQTERAGKDPEK